MSRVSVRPALALCVVMAAGSLSAGEETIRLKEGAGRDVTAARCGTCHSLDYIQMNAPLMNEAAWEKNMRKMIDTFGAPVDEEDARRILTYLSEYYSSSS